jgi:peptidoglycan/xylan/chitin deacetylase (PgdA/CDA1 family)
MAYGAARRSGALAALRWLHRARIPILCYHSVVDRPVPPSIGDRGGGLHLPADRFREQLRFLARHYRVVSLEEMIADASPRPRSVALTFDDGYANSLSVAAPILAEFGFPATVFLATDYLGTDLFWWDELCLRLATLEGRSFEPEAWGSVDLTSAQGVTRALARGDGLLRAATQEHRSRLFAALGGDEGTRTPLASALRPATWDECRAAPPGIRFGGHGSAHRLLGEIPLEAARDDVQQCGRALRTELGARAASVFCYPAGQWTPAVRAGLPAAGFPAAVLAGPHRADQRLARRSDEPTLLPRVGVAAQMTIAAFAGSLAGVRSLLYRNSCAPRSGAIPR